MLKKTTFLYLTAAVAAVAFLLYFGYHGWYLDRHFQRIEKDNSGQPVQMIFLKTGSVFPGYAQDQVVRLILTNDFATPRGYLFPYILGDTLRPDGIFYEARRTDSLEESKHSLWITGRKYPKTRSNLRVSAFVFMGRKPTKDGFTAFFLPPHSTVILENYKFLVKETALKQWFEVWEVEQLLVNGKIPFDDWIPDDLLCSGNVHLMNEAVGQTLWIDSQPKEWNILDDHPEVRLPKGEDAYLQATGIHKLYIKIETILMNLKSSSAVVWSILPFFRHALNGTNFGEDDLKQACSFTSLAQLLNLF